MRDRTAAATPEGLTVAIPVFNEEAILETNVQRVVAYLERLALPCQILIGSNGSTDATVGLGARLQARHPAVEFFHLPVRGVGLAFREFVRRARFPLLVSLDMDLSADIRFIERALPLLATHAIVVGSKRLAPQKRPAFRRLGSDTFLWCARRMTGLPYDDYSIGAKGYRLDFLRTYADRIDGGSSYVLDLCFAAHHDGRRVACVPVECEDRRTSKFNLFSEAVYKFQRLARLCLRSTAARHDFGRTGPVSVLRARLGALPSVQRRRLT